MPYQLISLPAPSQPVNHFQGETNLFIGLSGSFTYQGPADTLAFSVFVMQGGLDPTAFAAPYALRIGTIDVPLTYNPMSIPIPVGWAHMNIPKQSMATLGNANGLIVISSVPMENAHPVNLKDAWLVGFATPDVYKFVQPGENVSGVPTINYT